MINRIELILKTQNLTPTQFADAIGIQRSSMSHILARRNNPSLDFVMKVLARFPEINAEWMLTGKNQMFTAGISTSAPSQVLPHSKEQKVPEFEWDNKIETSAPLEQSKTPSPAPIQMSGHEKILPKVEQGSIHKSDIERIIVFFTDGTFKSYVG
jgi:transcriptional regulator with XRE-family HTH domain